MHNKLNRVGCKIWVLAEAYGYVVQFEPYQSVKKGKQVASSTKWGLGENVVQRLMKCLPSTVMNNYVTCFRMLTHLGVNNICAQQKQVTQMHYFWGQTAAKKECGHFRQRTSSKKSSAILTVVGLNDKRAVYIASFKFSEPKRFVRRLNKVE